MCYIPLITNEHLIGVKEELKRCWSQLSNKEVGEWNDAIDYLEAMNEAITNSLAEVDPFLPDVPKLSGRKRTLCIVAIDEYQVNYCHLS